MVAVYSYGLEDWEVFEDLYKKTSVSTLPVWLGPVSTKDLPCYSREYILANISSTQKSLSYVFLYFQPR